MAIPASFRYVGVLLIASALFVWQNTESVKSKRSYDMHTVVRQFTRYAIIGVANLAIGLGILNALSIFFDVYSGAPIILFNALSAAVAITHSYFWNKYWTFQSSAGVSGMEFSKFALVNVIALVMDTAIIYSVTTFVPPPSGVSPLLWENMAKLASIGVVVVWNFIGFKVFVFRRPAAKTAAPEETPPPGRAVSP